MIVSGNICVSGCIEGARVIVPVKPDWLRATRRLRAMDHNRNSDSHPAPVM